MGTAELTGRGAELAGRLGFNTACMPNRSLSEAMRLGREIGLAGVEVLSFADYRHSHGDLAGLYFDRLTDAERDRLQRLLSPFRHVSVHAPFWDIAPFSPNPGIRDESRRQLKAAVSVSAELGASTITTHLIPRTGYELSEYRGEVTGLYRELGDLAGDRDLTVTIETGFPLGIEEFASVIHDIDHPAVGANVDVGHLRGLVSAEKRETPEAAHIYNELLAQHIDTLGPKVYHLHLHDTRRRDFRDHKECGTGILDFPALFRRLLAMDYRGLANFELEEPDDVAALRRSHLHVLDAIGRATC